MEIWVGMLESISLKIIDRRNNEFSRWTYFHLKELDQIKINLPLCKYIKESNTSRIALQPESIDNHKTNIY